MDSFAHLRMECQGMRLFGRSRQLRRGDSSFSSSGYVFVPPPPGTSYSARAGGRAPGVILVLIHPLKTPIGRCTRAVFALGGKWKRNMGMGFMKCTSTGFGMSWSFGVSPSASLTPLSSLLVL